MAMIDYGAVVKKNGKIITDPNGSLFQNYSTLRYNNQGEWKEVEKFDELTEETYTESYFEKGENYIDETVVEAEVWSFNKKGSEGNTILSPEIDYLVEFKNYSFADNEMAVIGDEHFLIGFYKQGFSIAIDKHMCYWAGDIGMHLNSYDWFRNHKKGINYYIHDLNGNYITTIKLNKIDKTSDNLTAFIAKFEYNGDKYEVVYGYAMDPNPKYLFGKKSYLAPSREVINWKYDEETDEYIPVKSQHITKRAKYRKTLKFIKEWYLAGGN